MKLKYEDYTENTNLVIELSEILAGFSKINRYFSSENE